MKKAILLSCGLLAASFLSYAQTSKIPAATQPKPADSTAAKKPVSKTKSYEQVITKEAKSKKGLFTTHQVGDKFYFEIPKKHLGKDMLLVSQIAKLPSGIGGGYVNAGTSSREQLIIWEKFQEKIMIKIKSYTSVAADSLPISLSVKANNYEPTLYMFDIDLFSY
ncbi:MAG: hypothetical protein RI950_752 [Bacteroidota bacterium]